MDVTRLLKLLEAGDVAAWPALSRAIARQSDPALAAEALALLRALGHTRAAARWLASLQRARGLEGLRAALLASARGWPVSPLRALVCGLLSGAYRLIPAGAFAMGSPPGEVGRSDNERQRAVVIERPFLLKATPVTQAEWRAVMGDNPAYYQGDERRPVERVSWDDALRLGEALSAQEGGSYRLPTEAEWEYACRAGTAGPRYGRLDRIAWHSGNAGGVLQPVGQRQPNAWGLHDMLGSLWEWCQDPYARDPGEPARDGARVIRGGVWFGDPLGCRAARRYFYAQASPNPSVGVRLAASLA